MTHGQQFFCDRIEATLHTRCIKGFPHHFLAREHQREHPTLGKAITYRSVFCSDCQFQGCEWLQVESGAVVVGLILWLINTYIPMAAAIKSLLNIVVFVVVLIWLLQVFGLIGPINGLHIPNLK
jgi:hypothetical protein